MSGDLLRKRSVADEHYIPMSTCNTLYRPHHSGIQLLKPHIPLSEDGGNELHIPLTPSPDLVDHTEEVFSKLTGEQNRNSFSYATPFPVYSCPSFSYTSSQELPAGYYTPPTPFTTPSPASISQSFVFDPIYTPHTSYPTPPAMMIGSVGEECTPQTRNMSSSNLPPRHMTSDNLPPRPPSKRARTKPEKKSSTSASVRSTTKGKKNAVNKKIQELKASLLDYHTASDELWRPGGEPRKKNKSCQTTFKQPLQLPSYEEFASLALLLNVFHKEAIADAGRRYGANSKSKA